MADVAMSGKDTHQINGRTLTSLATGDCSALTFGAESMTMKRGKNGNTLISLNESGGMADHVIRIVRGTADDKFLNSLLTQMLANPAGFILLFGEFIKNIGDGKGNVAGDTYILTNGIFSKRVEVKDNAEGEPEQNVAEYHFKWGAAPRAIA